MKKFLNVLFSVCISIVIIVGVINFTVGFKQPYYFDIDYLNISELSGLSKDDIKLNYDYQLLYPGFCMRLGLELRIGRIIGNISA